MQDIRQKCKTIQALKKNTIDVPITKFLGAQKVNSLYKSKQILNSKPDDS